MVRSSDVINIDRNGRRRRSSKGRTRRQASVGERISTVVDADFVEDVLLAAFEPTEESRGRLVGGPEIEDESQEVGVEDEGDNPLREKKGIRTRPRVMKRKEERKNKEKTTMSLDTQRMVRIRPSSVLDIPRKQPQPK